MYYEEIIQKLRDRDERVTRCFFFWEGPTLQHLEELRKTDPIKAARLPKPVCNTCRPGLLKVLHSLYGNQHFVYEDMVTDLYIYLLQGDKLATIQDPKALMGWIVRTAYYYFLHENIANEYTAGNQQPPYQNMYKFVQESDNSGYSNRFIQLIHYTKTKQIELIR